jgi:RHS repeat-associated protein
MKHPTNTSLRIGRALLAALALGFAATSAAFASSGTHYYVNDHLATTFGIADAAGEIAAIEADAFGSPLAGEANSVRFTGKPYDEDLGAYVFPFRNYRADEARWMSADPSGFPDGVNGSFYVPNPLKGLDPLGLWTIERTAGVSASQNYYGLENDYIWVHEVSGSGMLAAGPGGGSSVSLNWLASGLAKSTFIPLALPSTTTFAIELGVSVGVNSDGSLSVSYAKGPTTTLSNGNLSLALGISHSFGSDNKSVSFDFSWGIANISSGAGLSFSGFGVTVGGGSNVAFAGGVKTVSYRSVE